MNRQTIFSAALIVGVATGLTAAPALRAQQQQPLPETPQAQTPAVDFTATRVAGYDVAQAHPDALQLSLDDAIQIALKHNTNYIVSQQNERAIGGLKLSALNALIPSLTAEAQTSSQQVNLAAMGFNERLVEPLVGSLLPAGYKISTIVTVDTTGAQINASQQLFNMPALEIYRASKATAQVATYNALLVRADVVQNVATQYLQVLADVDAIHNAEAQLKSDEELTRQADLSHQAGVGTHLDLLRAKVDQQQRAQQLIQARNSYDKDRIQLNRYMGIPATQEIALTDGVPYHNLDNLSVPEAMQIANERRKDLLSLRAQLRSAELQRRAVRYERLPALHVNGFYGVLGETHGLYHGVFAAVAGVDIPVFQEARLQGDQRMIDAQLRSLNNRVSGMETDVEAQIRSSRFDVESYNQLVQVARSNVALAQEELSDTQDRYRSGVDDDLPVVQAQATLADAQARLIASMFRYNQAKLQLARSIGVVETQYPTYLGVNELPVVKQ